MRILLCAAYVVLLLLIVHNSVLGAPKPRPRVGAAAKRSPRAATNVYNFPVEDKFGNGGSDDSDDRNYSASVQFMITGKMRNTLINQLGYLPAEVDDMEPQIAAVVIERSLPRPAKGMPASWKRANTRQNSKSSLSKWLGSVQSEAQKRLVKGWVKMNNSLKHITFHYVRPALPILLAATIVWFQGGNMLSISQNLVQSLWKRLTTRPATPPPVKKQLDGGGVLEAMKGFLPKSTTRVSQESTKVEAVPPTPPVAITTSQPSLHSRSNKVNLSALDKVVSQSWWARLSMKSKARSYGA